MKATDYSAVSNEAAFAAAYSLAQGNYLDPVSCNVPLDQSVLLGIGNLGITNADSAVPILGTYGLDPCLGIALYNKKTKTVAVIHNDENDTLAFERLLKQVRDNESDKIEIHLIGACYNRHDDDLNEFLLGNLCALLNKISHTPNVILKTFDVFDKPHPESFAIDARNGKLIRGGNDITGTLADAHKNKREYFTKCKIMSCDFDGRTIVNKAQHALT